MFKSKLAARRKVYIIQKDQHGLFVEDGGCKFRRIKPRYNPDPFKAGLDCRVLPSKFGPNFRLVALMGTISEAWEKENIQQLSHPPLFDMQSKLLKTKA